VLNPGQPKGQQVFVCHDNGNQTLSWVSVNDESATTAADKSYTDAQVAAEAAARIAGDAATLSSANSHSDAAVAVEAATRAAADATLGAAIVSETSRATSAENALNASKANLTGGNSFTGDQSITGNISVTGSETVKGTLSLPAATAGVSPSQPLDLVGSDGANPTLFRWFVNSGGKLDLFTATNGNAAADSGLMIGPDGKIAFAAGQTFPGTQNALTAGSGISIVGNTISNTGVLSFKGRNGAVSPASGDYSFSQISGTFTPSQAGAGTYAIDISGSASFLSGEAAATAATAGTIAARDGSGDLFANVFHGSGASLTNIPATALPATIVYNTQTNTYTAGSKQTFKASASTAGLSLDSGTAADPTTLASGDIWFNTTTNHLGFYNGAATKTLAFSDDNINGNANNVTGIVAVANGGTGATTASGARTSLGAAGTGTCTNQAVTATSGTGVTCTAITSAYVNNSIALTGTDINTSNQVVATHLTSPLPAAQGGTGFNGGAAANGSLPIGNGAGFSLATLTAGSNVAITNAGGSITIAATGSATPSFSSITGGNNTNQALVIGNGSSLAPTGTGTISATALSGELAATTSTANTIAARDASANLTASQFNGSGAGLTSLNASNITTGTIAGARIAPTRTSSSITSAVKATAGTTASVTATCPAGVLLGGGAQATTSDISHFTAIYESYPTSSTAWTATGVVTTNLGNGVTMTVTTWVVCSGS
jgi:hypothetical protein